MNRINWDELKTDRSSISKRYWQKLYYPTIVFTIGMYIFSVIYPGIVWAKVALLALLVHVSALTATQKIDSCLLKFTLLYGPSFLYSVIMSELLEQCMVDDIKIVIWTFLSGVGLLFISSIIVVDWQRFMRK